MRLTFLRYCIAAPVLVSALHAQTVDPINFSVIPASSTYTLSSGNPGANCSISGSSVNPTPSVASINPLGSFQSTGSQKFTIAAVANGSDTITVNYTVGNGDPSCVSGPGTIVFNVTVSTSGSMPPPPAMVSVTTANSPDAPIDGEPVSAATGELFGQDDTPDLRLGGPTGLEFRRYYASFLSANGVSSALGVNWMHNFDVSVAVKSGVATVTLFHGKTAVFKQSGTAWTLSSTERRPYQLVNATGGGYQFLDPNTNLIYSFSSAGVLGSIQDRNGNTITVTQGPNGPTQVSDGLGRTLTFTYKGTNLTKIQDQSGRTVSFLPFNPGNLLIGATNANGSFTTYLYTSTATAAGLMTSVTRPVGNIPLVQTFDSSGRVATQTDSLSDKMTMTYGSGTTNVAIAGGVTLTQGFGSNGNMTAQSDPSGASGSFAYDANTRPTSVTDRLGNQTKAVWDAASGLRTSVTDQLGNTTTYTNATSTFGPFTFYEVAGKTFADGTSVSLKRDANGNITSVIDQAGNTQSATYTSNGWLATFTNQADGVYTLTYNSNGMPASLQTPSLDTTTFGYDSAFRMNQVTNPDGSSRSIQYDGLDNVINGTDERSGYSYSGFDANNRIMLFTDALSAATGFAYDTNDRRVSATDPLKNTVTSAFDAQSRLKSMTNAAGNSVNYTYDNLNRVTAIADASGNGLTFARDAENRPTAITDALSRTVNITYDAHGNAIATTTPKQEKFSSSYDALNRLAASTDALSRTTQFTRDARGILSAEVLPGGVGAAFSLNSLGLATSVTDPVGQVWNQSYDGMGRLTGKTDPLGRKTSVTYDSRERPATATFPNGSVQFQYDATSNPTGLTYSDGTTLAFTYDADNRLTGGTGLSLSYDTAGRIVTSDGLQIARDSGGRISSVTYASGKTVNYSYNNRGFLSQVADWVSGNTAFTYDAAGQLTLIAYANGVTQATTFDADGRLAALKVGNGSTAISSIALTRDALGRVTSANRPAANVPSDPAGTLALAYDGAAQVIGSTYDGQGRVTQDSTRTYTWDLASHLTSYSGSDGSASSTYDALGQRISRTSGGITQNYVLDYALPLPSVSTVQSGGADQIYYVWLPDGTLLESITAVGSTRRFYHFDESGSVNFLTDGATGAVTDSYAIAPYGDFIAQTGTTANPFTFQGQYGVMRDGASSLFYMRARYYDSTTARFVTRDPLPPSDARSINPYQFAYGNPIENADPSGMDADSGEYDYTDYEATSNFISGVTPPRKTSARSQRPKHYYALDVAVAFLTESPNSFSTYQGYRSYLAAQSGLGVTQDPDAVKTESVIGDLGRRITAGTPAIVGALAPPSVTQPAQTPVPEGLSGDDLIRLFKKFSGDHPPSSQYTAPLPYTPPLQYTPPLPAISETERTLQAHVTEVATVQQKGAVETPPLSDYGEIF